MASKSDDKAAKPAKRSPRKTPSRAVQPQTQTAAATAPQAGGAKGLLRAGLKALNESAGHAVAALKTRDRILDASLVLFNQQGLAGVSTHRIAAELGISPGILHYHFRTKELIVSWLFRRFEERLAPCIDAHATVT